MTEKRFTLKMTDNKRYIVLTDNDLEISLKDNIIKKYPFSLVCENIDTFEPLLNEVMNVCAELNKKWEQTLRFEKHNQDLMEENEQLKSEIKLLRQKETTSKLNEIENSTMESFLKKQR